MLRSCTLVSILGVLSLGCTVGALTEPQPPASIAGLAITREAEVTELAVDLAAPGGTLDVVMRPDRLTVGGDVDGVDYTLTLLPDRLTIEEDNGLFLRTTVFGFVREGAPEATLDDLLDRLSEHGEVARAPDGRLGYPFDDSTAHRTVLDALGALQVQVPELAPEIALIGHATAALSTLQQSEDELEVLSGMRGPGELDVVWAGADGDDGCLHEAYVSKSYAAGSKIQLDAGPVSVSASAAKVSGTSICDPRYSPSAGTSGTMKGAHNVSGGSAAGCAVGFEAVYTAGGTKTAAAKNTECCQADGVVDSAAIGSLKATVFGKSFDLSAEDSCSTDMSDYHEVEITGNATICLDYDFFNEAYLLSTSLNAIADCS